ncbi:MAG: endo-1,4-beta-xylanase [Phycisphaeraceae bacterium]|nr:endo-1,4-beta-xylanase [Phycisphaeraceae bacterium]
MTHDGFTVTIQPMVQALIVLGFLLTAGYAANESPEPHAIERDWRADADERIKAIRQGDFLLEIQDHEGNPITGQDLKLVQTGHHFRFGVSVTESALLGRAAWNERYRRFILDHFNTVVSDNHMKWYSIEPRPGQRRFEPAEILMRFAREHDLSVRGHALFWAKERWTQPWVRDLDDDALRKAIDDHIQATVTRFKGRLIAWDVNNEMLTGTFFRDRLGDSIRAHMFIHARRFDPDVPLHVNEYDILGNDEKLGRMVDLIRFLRRAGAPVGGIGIQEHAAERIAPERADAPPEQRDEANVERQSHVKLEPEAMLARLDRLAELDMPIHLTEISFKTRDERRRAQAVEDFYRMGFSHPGVEAIVLWGFMGRLHWLGDEAALVDAEGRPLEPARRLSRLLNETWKTRESGRTDERGRAAFRGFYGRYEVRDPQALDRILGTVEFSPDRREVVLKLQTP